MYEQRLKRDEISEGRLLFFQKILEEKNLITNNMSLFSRIFKVYLWINSFLKFYLSPSILCAFLWNGRTFLKNNIYCKCKISFYLYGGNFYYSLLFFIKWIARMLKYYNLLLKNIKRSFNTLTIKSNMEKLLATFLLGFCMMLNFINVKASYTFLFHFTVYQFTLSHFNGHETF